MTIGGQPIPLLYASEGQGNPVSVTIGGREAQVLFAGLAPGFAGLYQVNAIVPPGISPSNDTPVTLTVAGQTSPPVTFAVR